MSAYSLTNWLSPEAAWRLIEATAFLLLTAVLARYVPRWLQAMGKTLAEKTRSTLDDNLLRITIAPLGKVIWLIGIYVTIVQIELPERIAFVIRGALFVVGTFIAMLVLYRVLNMMLGWYVSRLGGEKAKELKREFVPLIEKLLLLSVVLVGLILVMNHFNYNVMSLVTALGVGSLAIGLAAKDTLANTIAGFTIMVDRPFRQGDHITLADGKRGKVMEIGLRSTKIRTSDHAVLMVPNGSIVISNIINHDYPDARVNHTLSIGVGYETDVGRAKSAILEVAKSTAGVLQVPTPIVRAVAFGENQIKLELTVSLSRFEEQTDVDDELRCAILKKFKEVDIKIPTPLYAICLKGKEGSEIKR